MFGRTLMGWLSAFGRRGAPFPDESIRLMAEAWHRGELAVALELGRRGLERWPRSPDLHYMTGACHFDAARYDDALAAFEVAGRYAGDHPLALHIELHQALATVRLGRGTPELDPVPRGDALAHTSIVICSIDDAKFSAIEASYHALFEGSVHEIIRLSDARSLAEGYNRGLDRCRGEIVLFSHDDIRIAVPDFAARVHAHLLQHDVVGIAGTRFLAGASWIGAGWPHLAGQVGMDTPSGGGINVNAYGAVAPQAVPAQAVDGVLMAVRRDVAERLRFDQDNFDGWHLYDIDFSFRAALAGYRVAVADDLLLVHASKGGYGDGAWRRYAARFLQKFAAQLLSTGTARHPAPCSIPVSSAQEWRALTATRQTLKRQLRR